MLAEFVKTADWNKEKHVPVIDCAAEAAAGEALAVTVMVGKQVPHPNTPTHFIQWIALHFVPDGSKTSIELARCEFSAHGAAMPGATGPALTGASATFSVTLAVSGKLYATAYCNLHGLWSSEREIIVK